MNEDGYTLQKFWDDKCDPSGWNFVTTGLKNGDLYFITCFIKLFRRVTSNGAKISFFADTLGKFRVLNLIVKEIDQLEYVPQLANFSNDQIASWCTTNERDGFGPGNLIRLHPYLFSSKQFQISSTMATNGALYFIDLVKMALRVPFSAAAVPPLSDYQCQMHAREEFTQSQLREGQTIIIFPHAQSLPFDATHHLQLLANLATKRGFLVCSAVYGGEKPVPGTEPIAINLQSLIPFSELAGYVVALRSGIGDILSSSKARRVNLYYNSHLNFHDTPNAFGLGDCSDNLVVPSVGSVVDSNNPELFARQILDALLAQPYSYSRQFLPPIVHRYFKISKSNNQQVSFCECLGTPVGRYWLFANAVLAEGWSTPEHWGAWSIGFRSIIYMQMPDSFKFEENDEVSLVIDMECSISSNHPVLNFSIDMNSTRELFQFTDQQKRRTISLVLNSSQKSINIHRLIFDIENPASPAEQSAGGVSDSRLTGVGIRTCEYRKTTR
jgi:hypothetical protein